LVVVLACTLTCTVQSPMPTNCKLGSVLVENFAWVWSVTCWNNFLVRPKYSQGWNTLHDFCPNCQKSACSSQESSFCR